jgi:ElaB/YqjD/DUF883 family membrane-anchored ribosome-binding protein
MTRKAPALPRYTGRPGIHLARCRDVVGHDAVIGGFDLRRLTKARNGLNARTGRSPVKEAEMAVETRETSELATPSLGERLADAARQAAHVSHEARMVRSMAEDAVEEGVHRAKRAVKSAYRRGIETLEDAKDEGARYVKRRPFPAIGAAIFVGLVAGVAAGWFAGRRGRRQDP